MRTTSIRLALMGVAALAAVGCTTRAERRAHERYHEVFGTPERSDRVDLNTATQQQLSKLPGLTDEDAARIIANRPYGSKQGLLRKGVIAERKYEQIEDYVYVSKARGRDYED